MLYNSCYSICSEMTQYSRYKMRLGASGTSSLDTSRTTRQVRYPSVVGLVMLQVWCPLCKLAPFHVKAYIITQTGLISFSFFFFPSF